MSGKGDVTLCVFALRSRRSHTTRRRGGTPFTPVPGFVRSSMGEVLRAFVMRQPIMRALMFKELQHVRETEGEEEEVVDEIEEGLAVETVEDFTSGQA